MSLDRFSLDGKVAIVTGGAGGCGEEYGRALTAVGAQVVLADLDGERAEQHAKELRDAGPRGDRCARRHHRPRGRGGDSRSCHR